MIILKVTKSQVSPSQRIRGWGIKFIPPPANAVLEVSIRSFSNVKTKVVVEGVL